MPLPSGNFRGCWGFEGSRAGLCMRSADVIRLPSRLQSEWRRSEVSADILHFRHVPVGIQHQPNLFAHNILQSLFWRR